MKKILALVLCVLTIAALFVGCKPADNTPKGVLQAGYGRVDITPDKRYSYGIAGYGDSDKRLSRDVIDNLYITCTAFKDEDGAMFLLYHCDFLKVWMVLNNARTQISKKTGVPIENIIIATTHSHSAPSLDDNNPVMNDYAKVVKNAMIKAGEEAVADLKPAKLYTTEIVCEGFNEIRSIGVPTSMIDQELDNTMELIKITREGGKDIIMMNWQGHPIGQGAVPGEYVIASDVDIIRKNIETALDCNFIFFLGASGNVNNKLKKKNDENWTYVQNYEALTQKAVEAAANFKEVTNGAMKKTTTNVTLEFRTGGGQDNPAISVVSIGKSIAFVIVPYEMFSYSAKELKAYSKFDQTFIVTCAENHIGYLPTIDTPAHEYEVGVTNYVMGSAELLVKGYKSILDQLVK